MVTLWAVFGPGVFDPGVFDPSVFGPGVFGPGVFGPVVFDPSVFGLGDLAEMTSLCGRSQLVAVSVRLEMT